MRCSAHLECGVSTPFFPDLRPFPTRKAFRTLAGTRLRVGCYTCSREKSTVSGARLARKSGVETPHSKLERALNANQPLSGITTACERLVKSVWRFDLSTRRFIGQIELS